MAEPPAPGVAGEAGEPLQEHAASQIGAARDHLAQLSVTIAGAGAGAKPHAGGDAGRRGIREKATVKRSSPRPLFRDTVNQWIRRSTPKADE